MKNKKVLCFILALLLSFCMVACSRSGSSSGTTAYAQSNTQEDSPGTMLAQSSSGNTQSQRKVVEEKYQGVFVFLPADGNIYYNEFSIYVNESSIAYGLTHTDGMSESWGGEQLYIYTVGSVLMSDSPDRKMGTFTDVNTLVLEPADNHPRMKYSEIYGFLGSNLYKRQ